jgi:hypothetical protein
MLGCWWLSPPKSLRPESLSRIRVTNKGGGDDDDDDDDDAIDRYSLKLNALDEVV